MGQTRKFSGKIAIIALCAAVFLCESSQDVGARSGVTNSTEHNLIKDSDRVFLLSDSLRLKMLLELMKELWPAHPDNIKPMEEWLIQANSLLENVAIHEATLAEVSVKAGSFPDSIKAELDHLEEHRRRHVEDDNWKPEEVEDGADFTAHLAKLENEIGRLRLHILEDLKNAVDYRWWRDELIDLLSRLKAFHSYDIYGATVSSVMARLKFAKEIEKRSITDHQVAWEKANSSIADVADSPMYAGLKIAPQIGLVPIGKDRASGHWEFAHLQTGELPERDPESGSLILTDETGLVFVLLSGGKFKMGASIEGDDNRDEYAGPDESPVHEVSLDAFFISKYEMTQGQWQRVTGENPSEYGPHKLDSGQPRYLPSWNAEGQPANLMHPVEKVDWEDCRLVLSRLGLLLPTEAQWEYAGRAGTDTPWWTGEDPNGIDEGGNLADKYAKEHGGLSRWQFETGLNDGHTVHAPVGQYRPNAFGLHDTMGNLYEWVRDEYGPYDGGAAPYKNYRVIRGGAYDANAVYARSSARLWRQQRYGGRDPDVGCRPSKRVALK